MVLDLVFLFSSPPISVKPLSGKHSLQLQSTSVVVLNSKVPSSPFSTFWLPRTIKFVPSMKPFTDPTCQTWWISWPPLLFSSSSSTSKVRTSPAHLNWELFRLIIKSVITKNLRIPCRLTNQVCPIPRSILNLPNQAVLHFKHPNYSPIRPCLQLVCHLTNVVNTILWKLFRFSFGRLGCCKYYFKVCYIYSNHIFENFLIVILVWRWTRTILPNRRSLLLSFTTRIVEGSYCWPNARCSLRCFHARFLRFLLNGESSNLPYIKTPIFIIR